MALPTLDPHPYGCPVCVGHTPAQMPEVITQVCVKLRDLLYPSIHQVNPSRGKPYPILNLHLDVADFRPRVVLFPGWEDNRATARRRMDYARQVTLLGRIHEAGVRGESLQDAFGELPTDDLSEPLLLGLACTPPKMEEVILDLHDYLGEALRMTVTTIVRAPTRLQVLRIYAPTRERTPRIICFPGWTNVTERAADRVDEDQQLAMLETIEAESLREVPIEAWVDRVLH